LRTGGKWAKTGAGPVTAEDWAAVEDYMGFFEHCELLMRNGSLDTASFKALFGYRVENIIQNDVIVQAKLDRERDDWKLFISLLDRLGLKGRGTAP
jgi:hypothetical protein